MGKKQDWAEGEAVLCCDAVPQMTPQIPWEALELGLSCRIVPNRSLSAPQ